MKEKKAFKKNSFFSVVEQHGNIFTTKINYIEPLQKRRFSISISGQMKASLKENLLFSEYNFVPKTENMFKTRISLKALLTDVIDSQFYVGDKKCMS